MIRLEIEVIPRRDIKWDFGLFLSDEIPEDVERRVKWWVVRHSDEYLGSKPDSVDDITVQTPYDFVEGVLDSMEVPEHARRYIDRERVGDEAFLAIDYLLPVRCKTDDRIYQLIVEVLM